LQLPLSEPENANQLLVPPISISFSVSFLILSHKDVARNARIRSKMQFGPSSFHLARIIYAKLSIEICLDKMQTDGEN